MTVVVFNWTRNIDEEKLEIHRGGVGLLVKKATKKKK